MRPGSVIAIALLSCTRGIDSNVQIVVPCNQPDVFAGVEYVSIRVESPNLDAPREISLPFNAHKGSLSGVPPVQNAIVTVLGNKIDPTKAAGADILGSVGSLDLSGASKLSSLAIQIGLVNSFMTTTNGTACVGLKAWRQGHTMTTLNDGTVFIAGGEQLTNNTSTLIRQTEIYNPGTGVFTAGPPLPEGRAYHTATLLLSGRVLLCGGEGVENNATASLRSCSLYDPPSQTYIQPEPTLAFGRTDHTATLLANGHVVIAGGRGIPSDYYAHTEIFDETKSAFSNSIEMEAVRSQHTATLIDGSHVLFVGGLDDQTVATDAEVWSETSTASAGVLGQARYAHAAALIGDGRVLIAGGFIDVPGGNPTPTDSGEVYDPEQSALVCSAGLHLNEARGNLIGVTLPAGPLMINGALFAGGTAVGGTVSATAEIATSNLSRSCQEIAIVPSTGTLSNARTRAQAAVLTGGEVLIAGGSAQTGTTAVAVTPAELFVTPR